MSGAPQWTSRTGFLLAAIGFAVGLGNIWRFPYVTGENGGGAFVIVYLLCALAIGVPFLIAEILIGRRGGKSPPGSMRTVAIAEGSSPAWAGAGFLHLATAFLISVVYVVVAGWVLAYLFEALTSGFAGVDAQSATGAFDAFVADFTALGLWSFAVLAISTLVLYFGVQNGIERTVRVLMPTLFTLLVVLAIYNVFVGGFNDALAYLFTPDFSKVDANMVLAAIGQAFFSIGVGMAGMMTFGAYLPADVSIARSAVIIVLADTAVALTAGLVIFPAVFHYGLDPAGGAGLIFQTLPVAFAQMPGGHVVSVLFFLLLTVAAVTSLVGLLESLVSWLCFWVNLSRHMAATVVGITVALFSVVSVLSFNVWSDVTIAGSTLGTVLDFIPNQIMLPLGGLLIALFVGWVVRADTARGELDLGDTAFALWRVLVRYLAPLAVVVVLVVGISG